MKKILLLILIFINITSFSQNSKINYLSRNDYVMLKFTGGCAFNDKDSSISKVFGANLGIKRDNTVYIIDAVLPIYTFGYFNLGVGKFFSPNIYAAGLLGVGYNNNMNRYYTSAGIEAGVVINKINISTSYNLIGKDVSVVSLKVGYTFYDSYNYGNRKNRKYKTKK
jgi:hypothetical protein